jgi:NAD(P)-dependent dehydrogenase (short-subunit alcohol dehydrogenase family)
MGKTVLITGASSSIGNAAANLFAARGWNVVATIRDPANAVELSGHAEVLLTRLDVQDTDSIRRTIDAGIARFGSIDALVNNAGYGQYGRSELRYLVGNDTRGFIKARRELSDSEYVAFMRSNFLTGPPKRRRSLGSGNPVARLLFHC